MKSTFFGRHSLLILMAVFFFAPFALRGARVSVQGMRNNVQDWLPNTFQETAEMKWFWTHFLGERFIVASWAGCGENDESYKIILQKLIAETPPSELVKIAANEEAQRHAVEEVAAEEEKPQEQERAMHNRSLERPGDFIGDRLELFAASPDKLNWGGRNEKWLVGKNNIWYFIEPNGDLYEWGSGDAPLGAFAGSVWRKWFGGQVSGKHIASFDALDGPWYYENPRRLDAQLFKTVTTGPDVLAAMTSENGVLRDNLEEAHARLKGSLFGPDGKQTCLIMTLTEAGCANLHRVLGRGMLGKPRGRIYNLAEESGVAMADLHLGGPIVDNVAIDEEGTITLVRLVSLCVVLGVGLAYACFRTVSATLMVFFVGGLSAVASLALVGWCGSTVDAILMSMPSLVYVLGISGAVHLVNYYREAVEETGFVGAPGKAILHGWKPALLCSITTALGLFSLVTSEIVPIRKFGIYSGVAVIATLFLLFTYLPAALQLWPQQPRTEAQKKRAENPWYEEYLSKFWERFGGGIIRHHFLVSSACLLTVIIVGYGVTRIRTTVNMLKMFDGSAKILHDYAWLENNLGCLVPMEIVVKVEPRMMLPPAAARTGEAANNPEAPFQLSFLDRLEIVDRVQKVVEKEFGEEGRNIAGKSMSAVTFAPVLPEAKGDTLTFSKRSGTNSRLESHRDEFLKSEYLRVDREDQSELLRISLRIASLKDVDFGRFVQELKCTVEPVMAAYRDREEIQRKLVEVRESKKFANARVLVVGAPLGPSKKSTKAKDTNEETVTQLTAENSTAAERAVAGFGINQTKIFSETLRDLLVVSRLRVDWYDPAAEPLPENWKERLAQYDCVVMVKDHPSYQFDQVKETAKLTLDMRRHICDPRQVVIASKPPAVSAIYTGVVPIVYKTQRTLLVSLIESTAWSFVTIAPLMMFLSRSAWAGMVAMLPNVLPVFVIFGAMGWLNIEVDIGSMMTASIALGVAVDDTIHYLTWFRQELDKGSDRHTSILVAYKRCATPTFQAALISGLGLSIFAFSTFTPTQRFGYLMLTILWMGVVAELIFFPALLAGPLGRCFKPRLQPATNAANLRVPEGSRIDAAHNSQESHASQLDAQRSAT